MPSSPPYLDPDVLNKIDALELVARTVVEGFIAGPHKSPYHGQSVEFAQHREYTQGDDFRHIDWKVFGKSDRYYVKEYEEETNLRLALVVDSSASMTYRGRRAPFSKMEAACRMAAALAHLALQQQDAVGLITFSDRIDTTLAPRANRHHLRAILSALVNVHHPPKTALGAIIAEVAAALPRRGLVALISDLFDDEKALLDSLRLLRTRGHDVIVFHVLDPDELDLPFDDVKRFRALELIAGEHLLKLADPRHIRSAYRAVVEEFTRAVRGGCLANKIDYALIRTDVPLDVSLATFLATRAKRRR